MTPYSRQFDQTVISSREDGSPFATRVIGDTSSTLRTEHDMHRIDRSGYYVDAFSHPSPEVWQVPPNHLIVLFLIIVFCTFSSTGEQRIETTTYEGSMVSSTVSTLDGSKLYSRKLGSEFAGDKNSDIGVDIHNELTVITEQTFLPTSTHSRDVQRYAQGCFIYHENLIPPSEGTAIWNGACVKVATYQDAYTTGSALAQLIDHQTTASSYAAPCAKDVTSDNLSFFPTSMAIVDSVCYTSCNNQPISSTLVMQDEYNYWKQAVDFVLDEHFAVSAMGTDSDK